MTVEITQLMEYMQSVLAQDFRTYECRPSGPGALLTFSTNNFCNTTASVVLMSQILQHS